MSFDCLQEAIIRTQNPTVAGLDARLEYVPQPMIDALCDIVPAVKPQSAYYELLGWEGMEMLERTIRYAKAKGMYVIADVKRGDIGATASAYAEGWLGKTVVGSVQLPCFDADCVTVNGYMGADAVNPFLKIANQEDKALFVLVRTSNPSAVDLQDLDINGKKIYDVMGALAARWGEGYLDRYGYNRVGAVVGATWPEQLAQLREALPHTFLLVPGYGAQGGTAEDVRFAFDEKGHGAVVNSSRGIMCAWKKTGNDGADYQDAARAAAVEMRDAITAITPILD